MVAVTGQVVIRIKAALGRSCPGIVGAVGRWRLCLVDITAGAVPRAPMVCSLWMGVVADWGSTRSCAGTADGGVGYAGGWGRDAECAGRHGVLSGLVSCVLADDAGAPFWDVIPDAPDHQRSAGSPA